MKRAAREQFDSWAESYDQLVLNRFMFGPSHRAFIEELLQWRKRGGPERFDVLDVGSGTGGLAAMLIESRLAGRVAGLDYAEQMCRVARGKAAEYAKDGSAVFVRGDSEHLGFGAGSFDVVTCSNSFHHYPHQADVLAEMRRVLRPGGQLMIIDGFRDNVVGWLVFDVFVRAVEGEVHHVTWSTMRRMFQDAGLVDVRQRKLNFWMPLLLTVGTVPPDVPSS
jgi:ubiquinone/menaquinone biosynthesis C-methylase UbiE